MMRIDADRLLRLSVVIDERSFSRAAARLFISQPTLTASIAQLESEVNVKLLERGRHGAVPTEFGKQLYEHAKIIEAELGRAQRGLIALAGGTQGKVMIGATSGAGLSMACPAICRLLGARPDLQVEFAEEDSEGDLLVRLRRRELDLVLCPSVSMPLHEDLRGEPIFKTRRVLVTRTGHPVGEGGVTVKALSSYRLVVPKDTSELRIRYNEMFSAMGIPFPTRTVVAASLAAAKEIIMQSNAFSIFTELSVTAEVRRGLLKTYELNIPTDYWYQAIFCGNVPVTPAMTAFLTELLTVCREHDIEVQDAIASGPLPCNS